MTASQRHRRRRHSTKPFNKALLAMMVLGIFAVLAGLSGVAYIVSIAASAPPLSSLKARDLGGATQVFAADGQRLGFIQADEFRQTVPGSKIPKVMKDATVAIEDERFYKHKGVDYTGIVRAAFKNLTSGKTIQGGSTITQQLIRSIYISRERTFQRKIREAKLAEELENEHDKEWILDQYLNSVPFGTVGGQTAIGVQAASRMYFGKPASKLDLHEAALLAGLPQAPSLYSPVREEGAALTRRNEVLRKMADLDMVTQAQADAAIARPLDLKQSRYFVSRRESYFFDYVKDELIKQYGADQVRKGGLRVYTTIDLKKQQAARKAINDNLEGVGPSSAIVTIDPKNGWIKAMAASSKYAQSKFNLAAQGHRQPGSVFKVMALMTALRRGVDPKRTSYNGHSPFSVTNDRQWGSFDITNYGGSNYGTLNLFEATLRSVNTVFIQLALDLGPAEVAKTARDLGIRTKLDGYPAESLGGLTIGVSPLEVANAFATIASGGYRSRPTAIRKIVFPDGHEELPGRFKVRRTKVFKDGVTRAATEILEANIKRGTGGRAEIGCPAAGKTGTTDKNNDAWFAGFTPRLATAVWVGYPNAQVQMLGLFNGANVDGGTFPAKIWGEYMKVAKGSYCGDWASPKEPIRFSPFFGKHARTGTKEDSVDLDGDGVPDEKKSDTGDEQDDAQPGDQGDGERDQGTGGGTQQGNDTGDGQGNGGGGTGGGGTEFDPDFYESPPQGAPG